MEELTLTPNRQNPPIAGERSLTFQRPSETFSNASDFTIERSQFITVQGDMHMHHGSGPANPSQEQPRSSAGQGQSAQPTLSSQSTPADEICPANELYCGQLWHWGRGFPLYVPEPQRNLPLEYRAKGVDIGDVGMVTEDGIWLFFFNIFVAGDHPINRGLVPQDFRPLQPYRPEHVVELDHGPGHFVSSSVEAGGPDVYFENFPHREFLFNCKGHRGAVLTLPQGSQLRKLGHRVQMEQYAIQNAESWYTYIKDPNGWSCTIANGGLYLITGSEKSVEGGIATFQRPAAGNDFHLIFKPFRDQQIGYKYLFNQNTSAVTKNFPAPLPEDDRPWPMNNTIFLHGFSLSLGHGIWGRLFGQVGICDIQGPQNAADSYRPFGSTSSLSSIFSLNFNFLGGGASGGKRHSNAGDKRVQTLDLSAPPRFVHPSSIINEYILQKVPHATVAITHDDVWSNISPRHGDPSFTAPSLPDLIQHVCERFEIEEKNGAAYLVPGPNLMLHSDGSHPEEVEEETIVVAPLEDAPPAVKLGPSLSISIPTPTPCAERKRALLIGIRICKDTQYPELPAAHRDVEEMRKLLLEVYGYKEDEITILIDDRLKGHVQPTRANILAAIDKFVEDVKPGDRLFFYYSGHSTRVENRINTKEDGMDECLVPMDGEDHKIIENELHWRLVKPLPAGACLVAVLDTFHSGSLLGLKHYRCNRVFVPWKSRGRRNSEEIRNKIVRRDAVLLETNPLPPTDGLATAVSTGSRARSQRRTTRVLGMHSDTSTMPILRPPSPAPSFSALHVQTPNSLALTETPARLHDGDTTPPRHSVSGNQIVRRRMSLLSITSNGSVVPPSPNGSRRGSGNPTVERRMSALSTTSNWSAVPPSPNGSRRGSLRRMRRGSGDINWTGGFPAQSSTPSLVVMRAETYNAPTLAEAHARLHEPSALLRRSASGNPTVERRMSAHSIPSDWSAVPPSSQSGTRRGFLRRMLSRTPSLFVSAPERVHSAQQQLPKSPSVFDEALHVEAPNYLALTETPARLHDGDTTPLRRSASGNRIVRRRMSLLSTTSNRSVVPPSPNGSRRGSGNPTVERRMSAHSIPSDWSAVPPSSQSGTRRGFLRRMLSRTQSLFVSAQKQLSESPWILDEEHRRYDSPIPRFPCTGFCRDQAASWDEDDAVKADVISLALGDCCEVDGKSLTSHLVDLLRENPNRTVENVMVTISHDMYSMALKRHTRAIEYKRNKKKYIVNLTQRITRLQLKESSKAPSLTFDPAIAVASSASSSRPANGHKLAAPLRKAADSLLKMKAHLKEALQSNIYDDFDNIQNPELSSPRPLDMNRMWTM